MPDPNTVSPGNAGGNVNLQNAPGADFNFDDLFPNPEVPAQPQTATSGTTTQTPQATTPDQFFLRNTDGTIAYRSAEDALTGIAHKDELVKRYRDYLDANGIDPNELKPRQQPQTVAPSTQVDPNALDSGKLFDDLAAAAQCGDKAAYGRIQETYQRKIAQNVVENYLAPYAPLMAETARQRAIREVTKEIPDFPSFIGTEAFNRVRDSIPIYKDMLQLGENNPEASRRLPEVYKSMYLISQGLNRQAQNSQPQAPLTVPPVQNTPTVRPQTTMSPTSITPPAPGIDTRNWTTNREARKQLINDMDAQGWKDKDWRSVGS
jgi:hypothetical protein